MKKITKKLKTTMGIFLMAAVLFAGIGTINLIQIDPPGGCLTINQVSLTE